MILTKNKKKQIEGIDFNKSYPVIEAVKLLKEKKFVKFDESIEVSINTGIDSKQSDQNVRGSFVPPHGLGKKVDIAVFAQGKAAEEANALGVKKVGGEDLVTALQEKIDVDVIIATPDMMAVVSKIAKVLGPKGLMPNPKLGSVTENLKTAISDAKSGQAEIRNDKDGNIGVSIGKKSFSDDQLMKNYNAILDALEKEKSNNTLKGDLIRGVFATSTMGVSYKVKLGKSI